MAKFEANFNNKGFNEYLNNHCSDIRINKAGKVIRLYLKDHIVEVIANGFIKSDTIAKIRSEIGTELYEAQTELRSSNKNKSVYEDGEVLIPIRFRISLPSGSIWLAKAINDTDNTVLRSQMTISIVNPYKYIDFIENNGIFKIENKSYFIRAMELYLAYEFIRAEKLGNLYSYAIGWKVISHRIYSPRNEFLGVTHSSWNKDFEEVMRLHDIDEQDSYASSFEVAKSIIWKSPVLTMVFLYNVIAIANDWIVDLMKRCEEHKTEDNVRRIFPSICI